MAHRNLYSPGHTIPLSTCDYIINGLPRVRYHQYINRPGPNSRSPFCRKTSFHFEDPYIEGNTRMIRHNPASYWFQAPLPPKPEYLPMVLLLPVLVYNCQRMAVPMAILIQPKE